MDVLYVLRLQNEKWYIGRSSNLERRFTQHMNGTGAKWTVLHIPINIHESRPLVSDEDEDLVTLEYMKQYGIYNVRGGTYCAVEFRPWHVKEIKKRLVVVKELEVVEEVEEVEEVKEEVKEEVIVEILITQEEIDEQKKIEAHIRMENAILQQQQDEIREELKKQLEAQKKTTEESDTKKILNTIVSDTKKSFEKISNEFTNPNSELLSGRWFKKLFR
jgi:hypothetical protein